MSKSVLELARSMQTELMRIRQHLHAHPELSFQEFETAAFIQRELQSLGIDHGVVARTGIVATLTGVSPDERILGLRADIDALPITELNDTPYVSKTPGVMHACGHDVHTTWLLGAARILHELRNEWRGTVRLYFQPGEELNPGGASRMIQDGVLETLRPEKMFALHVTPDLPVGQIGIGDGPVMASVDDIYITIRGPGGHAAAPHKTVDTVLLAAEIITGLQKLISRHKHPFTPSVLSICTVNAGHATNVIPDTVTLSGTLRCMDDTWRDTAQALIHTFVGSCGRGTGAAVECRIDRGYPVVYNDSGATDYAATCLRTIFGADALVSLPQSLGGEDFAYFANEVPASFLRVGTGSAAQGTTHPLHTPHFDIDEAALPIGAAVLAALVVNG